MSYHGLQATLEIRALASEGMIDKELVGVMSGSGAAQDFYTKMFPITTGAGVVTNDATQVQVFKRDPAGTTWTQLTATTHYTITGASGLVQLTVAGNPVGDAGKLLSVSYYTLQEVARAQGFTATQGSEVLDIYEMGSKYPSELKEGKVTVAGSIRALYVNRALFGAVLSLSDFYKRAAKLSFTVYPNKKVAGQPYIKCVAAKFTGGTLEGGVDAVILNNLTLKALAVEEGTVA